MLKNLVLIWLMMILAVGKLQSQDIHFSQFFSNPVYLNPANAGYGEQSWRFFLGSKSQWNSFTNAYNTYFFSTDTRLPFSIGKNIQPAAGLLIIADKAGDAGFGSTTLSLSLAANYTLPGKAGQISLAIMPGIIQYALDFGFLYFDNQYDGQSYSPSASSGELFSGNDMILPDISAGLLYGTSLFGEQKPLSAGISFFHLNGAQFSFFGDATSMLPVKMQAHAQMDFPLNSRLTIIPQIFYSSQWFHKEFVTGAQLKVFSPGQTVNPHYLGLHLRSGDAAILSWVFGFNSFLIGFSYDINFSSLSKVSRGRGGFEFSLQYAISPKPVPSFRPTHICPTYI